ncbi:MAG: hypothetical protein M3460_10000 [Actinomycetota bacterium]|nr:hypothetical protein [Actinomycetota bacterium]
MLDGALRAELADLLDKLRSARSVAVLHITHDLALAQRSCDRLVVLRAGRVVEQGPTDVLLSRPKHPYTAALFSAARTLSAPSSCPPPPGGTHDRPRRVQGRCAGHGHPQP